MHKFNTTGQTKPNKIVTKTSLSWWQRKYSSIHDTKSGFFWFSAYNVDEVSNMIRTPPPIPIILPICTSKQWTKGNGEYQYGKLNSKSLFLSLRFKYTIDL